MPTIEQKHIDRVLLLEKISHQLEGSPLAHADVVNIGYSLGFEREYILELLQYLKVNGYIESHLDPYFASLTSHGSRLAHHSMEPA